MTTTPTEEGVKAIVAELAGEVAAIVEKKMEGWPKEVSGVADRLTSIVTEQVIVLLSGDVAALRQALVADVIKVIQSGKGPVAKSFTALA